MGSGDRYYGYGPISALCTAVIIQLFNPAPSQPPPPPSVARSGVLNDHGYPSPPPSADSSPQMGSELASAPKATTTSHWPREGIDTPPHSPVVDETAKNIPDLMDFIAYALYRTRLPTPIIHSALVLLTRLKKLYPSARGTSSSPHRLFLSALMLASKMSMDDTYSNRSWCIVGQQLFTLPEVNRMERELFGFLNWNCCVGGPELEAWTAEWLSPDGIVGDVAASSETSSKGSAATGRRGSEDRKRRRSSTTGSSSQSQPSKHSPVVSSHAESPSSDRHRQATDAAHALLRSDSPTLSSSQAAPPARRVSVPDLPSSTSAPSIVESHQWAAPLSPSSPCRVRSVSQPRWTSSNRPSHEPMHMRQSSDASMRSVSSVSDSEASSGSASVQIPPSMCCSSIGSPHSYHGSESPASLGPPRTPDEFEEGFVAPVVTKWDERSHQVGCDDVDGSNAVDGKTERPPLDTTAPASDWRR